MTTTFFIKKKLLYRFSSSMQAAPKAQTVYTGCLLLINTQAARALEIQVATIRFLYHFYRLPSIDRPSQAGVSA